MPREPFELSGLLTPGGFGDQSILFSEIYVADGPEGIATARPLTRWNDRLSAAPLPEIETVSWDNGEEGDKVEGVFFWPPSRKGEKGLPLIVDLHGGPFGGHKSRRKRRSIQGALKSPGFQVVPARRTDQSIGADGGIKPS